MVVNVASLRKNLIPWPLIGMRFLSCEPANVKNRKTVRMESGGGGGSHCSYF
jgi:hypothetical protein